MSRGCDLAQRILTSTASCSCSPSTTSACVAQLINNQWHTLFGFRISLGVFALTPVVSANIYPATAHLPHHILLIDAVSSHAPIRTAPTARTMRRPPAAAAAIPGTSSICAVLCLVFVCFVCCFVLALDPCSLLLFHLSKSCCWDVVYGAPRRRSSSNKLHQLRVG
jgi:hypothetical protein